MVAMLETATGVKAFSVGKPSPVMMRAARKELGLTTDETTMIGDTMETDILGGVQLGFHTVLVLSGGTKRGRSATLRLSAGDRRRFAGQSRPGAGRERLGSPRACAEEPVLKERPVGKPNRRALKYATSAARR